MGLIVKDKQVGAMADAWAAFVDGKDPPLEKVDVSGLVGMALAVKDGDELVCVCVFVYVRVWREHWCLNCSACVHTHTHKRTHVYTHADAQTQTLALTRARAHVRTRAHRQAHTHPSTHLRTRTHTHAHIPTLQRAGHHEACCCAELQGHGLVLPQQARVYHRGRMCDDPRPLLVPWCACPAELFHS